MQVILHLPQSKEEEQSLKERVAKVYAKAIVEELKSISCPIGQKQELIQKLEDALLEVQKKQTEKSAAIE